MTKSSHASPLVAVFGVALLAMACLGSPDLGMLEPIQPGGGTRAVVATDAERAAARVAAFAFADRPEAAARALDGLSELDGAALYDNARDVLEAAGGIRAYTAHAKAFLARDDLDAALRRRLERFVAARPLAVAKRRESEDWRFRIGAVFNRMSESLGRLAFGGSLGAVETPRTALSTLLTARSLPDVSLRQRQALRAYEEHLARNPDEEGAPALRARVTALRSALEEQRSHEARERARAALDAGAARAGLLHAQRAERTLPGNALALGLVHEARAQLGRETERARGAYEATARIGVPVDSGQRARLEEVGRAIWMGRGDDLAAPAARWLAGGAPAALGDELAFIATLPAAHQAGHDDAFHTALERIDGSMARHARYALADHDQNPYGSYAAAREWERKVLFRWVLLGRRLNGPIDRGLPRPLEYILDLPGYAIALVTAPLRAFRISGARAKLGGPVLREGGRYVERYPDGTFAADVNRDLEARWLARGHLTRALAHHSALPLREQDPATLGDYRHRIAAVLVATADGESRDDVALGIYRAVVAKYPNTPAAADARVAARERLDAASPQRIRVSRDFLVAHPDLWAPDALALRPELLDGDRHNGELDTSGVSLLGRAFVEIHMRDGNAKVRELSPTRFSRFVARLEHASDRQLASDVREKAQPDPQRDRFFENARLGVASQTDFSPTARSTAEIETSAERYGPIEPDRVLPVELVLRGDLEALGLAAFPRIPLPAPTPDAFLYE